MKSFGSANGPFWASWGWSRSHAAMRAAVRDLATFDSSASPPLSPSTLLLEERGSSGPPELEFSEVKPLGGPREDPGWTPISGPPKSAVREDPGWTSTEGGPFECGRATTPPSRLPCSGDDDESSP